MAEVQSEAQRIGEVIRQARVLRRSSQNDVAAALGYHQSKVSRLESGRGTQDIHMLREVARVLDIPPDRLGLAPSLPAGPSTPETEDMRRRRLLTAGAAVLAVPATPLIPTHPELVQSLLPGPSPAFTEPVGDLPQLRKQTADARRLFCTCDYAVLERTLPALIGQLRRAVADDPGSSDLSGLLATAYQTSAGLLLKQSDLGNAWLAVGRAMAEAERSGDPVVLASSVRVHAHVLARDGHSAQAVTLVRHTADQLTGSYDQRSPEYLAALGLLLLRGVTAASTGGDRSATEDFLAEARDVAHYVSLDRPDAWANFSPTNVTLHGISAMVVFGDAGVALDAARPLMRRHIPVPERRAALWVETARAYNQQGRLADGYQALRIAESCAAQDIRRPAVRELVADMAARDRRRTLPELHHFSRRLGVPA
ncbi:helix-turn-helix domain-containing protein [Streptomyces katsurahamanus]|uniref:Helix-turn-helix transcriptional regulator n=1 Tax=Streptomyces katsurahamanus TaxID=2577098 RepID=A0ABW9NR97_9ACTN|nr:helix-turn-helix transcriptional regulator [Streptomyces katsurahamanus]MQS35828.1 helix-turn-helix transcriptional regulator [Streptomyces katsurahamanus]